jgi:hypothetical protein
MNYDNYNREERYLCAHLFRLLHEPKDNHWALRSFIGHSEPFSDVRLYCEVALIRDSYFVRKPAAQQFMDNLVRLVMQQEGVARCRLYSELPDALGDPRKTHPRDIHRKGIDALSQQEQRVFGAIRGMFNAKPDLAICFGSSMLVYEAKFTLGFTASQIQRTRQIAEVWAELLHHDLKFAEEPRFEVRTLGMSKHSPDASWEQVFRIAQKLYPPDDRSRLAFQNALELGS